MKNTIDVIVLLAIAAAYIYYVRTGYTKFMQCTLTVFCLTVLNQCLNGKWLNVAVQTVGMLFFLYWWWRRNNSSRDT